jgi:hypothetical protein
MAVCVIALLAGCGAEKPDAAGPKAVVPGSAATGEAAASAAAAPAATLKLTLSDVVVGEKDGAVQILMNLHYYKDVLSRLDAGGRAQVVARTAQQLALKQLSGPEYASRAKVRVWAIAMTKFDEYGNSDPASIQKYGSVDFVRAADGELTESGNTLKFPDGPM